jgi:predicted acetyltransferase
VEQLREIACDPARFLASRNDREALGEPVILPDGSSAKRLPGFERWLWDGEFAGSISLRWQRGTAELPPACMGHVGYSVVPWKRRKGYATRALALMLPEARAVGLPYVEIVTDADNVPSQRVVLVNGGTLVERFTKAAAWGGGDALRFRIALDEV